MEGFDNDERLAILCHLRQIEARRQLEFIENIKVLFSENGNVRQAELAKIAFADDHKTLGQALEVLSRRK